MSTRTATKNEVIHLIDHTVLQLTELMALVENDKVNTIPFEGSWTAAQLLQHVTKSVAEMTKAMQRHAKPANREADERIEELKTLFLDFSIKMESPEFIVPEAGIHKKQIAIDELNKSLSEFKFAANEANSTELVDGLPLGSITKLEIVHFTLFHTQRHLHQMKKICNALNNFTTNNSTN
jgi:hypothetical protein